jgi:uncharacterized protein (TIGR02646 family)
MRKLEKGHEPQVLIDNAEQWTKRLLELIAKGEPYHQVEGRYRNDEIREALRIETKRKCAYCESEIEAVSYPHIEHKQPKSQFPELTFSWANLTLSCAVCNTNKGNRVPTQQNYVDPYAEDPSDRFDFLGPFMLSKDNSAENMINWIRLNRTELILERADSVRQVEQIFKRASLIPLEARSEFLELSLGSLLGEESKYTMAATAAARHFLASLEIA